MKRCHRCHLVATELPPPHARNHHHSYLNSSSSSSNARGGNGGNGGTYRVGARPRARPPAHTRMCASRSPDSRKSCHSEFRRDFVEIAPTDAAAGLMQQRGSTQ